MSDGGTQRDKIWRCMHSILYTERAQHDTEARLVLLVVKCVLFLPPLSLGVQVVPLHVIMNGGIKLRWNQASTCAPIGSP